MWWGGVERVKDLVWIGDENWGDWGDGMKYNKTQQLNFFVLRTSYRISITKTHSLMITKKFDRFVNRLNLFDVID